MATFSPDASDVFRDHNTKFIPSSGAYNPAKSYIRTYLKQMEEIVSALATADNFQGAWDASTGSFPSGAQEGYSWIASTPGTVGGKYFGEGDQLVALVNGASTSTYAGNWVVIPAWTSGVVAAVDAGAGTANAIQITTEKPVSDDTIVVFTLDTSTTSSPVTVSINGGTALTAVTNRGNNATGLTAGMEIWGRIRSSDNTFRLLNDQDVSALVAQAEEARDIAVAAAEDAANKVSKAGDTMTGPLVLYGDPVLPLEAATKDYVDNNGAALPIGTLTFVDVQGDAVEMTTSVSISASSSSLTVSGASFTADDVGKSIWVSGAGAAGASLEASIASFVSATNVLLTSPAATTLSSSSQTVIYGTDARQAFVDAMGDGDVHVYVPRGLYYMSGPVGVFANTRITWHPDAGIILTANNFLINGVYLDDDYATGYDGPGNIHIDGGEYRCSTPRLSGQIAFIQISHAHDVLIENIRVTRQWSGHAIELNSTKKGRVRNSYFGGQSLNVGDDGREAINIDFSYETGFPSQGAWDGTVCDDVVVEGCEFDGFQVAVGSHGATEPSPHQKGIRILNNTIRNSGQYAIWGRYWQGAQIVGNNIDTVGGQAILIDTSENTLITRNRISNAGAATPNHAIQVQECSGSVVKNNVVLGTSHTYGLRAFSGSGNIFDTQNIEAGTSGVINISEPDAEINGSYNATISDDAVWTLSVPSGMTQGAVSIQTRSASAGTVHAFYWFRVAATGAMTLIARPSGDTNGSTTGILTGTTGTDGVMTVSAHNNGNLYIENRTGSGKVVDVQFFGTVP